MMMMMMMIHGWDDAEPRSRRTGFRILYRGSLALSLARSIVYRMGDLEDVRGRGWVRPPPPLCDNKTTGAIRLGPHPRDPPARPSRASSPNRLPGCQTLRSWASSMHSGGRPDHVLSAKIRRLASDSISPRRDHSTVCLSLSRSLGRTSRSGTPPHVTEELLLPLDPPDN
jgi:hypothetical protein